MRLLFAAAELAPFVRTGGLGDAVAGLAGALAASGEEVTVAVPGYADVAGQGRKLPGRPWRRVRTGTVTVLFFQDESFARPGVYGPGPGAAYEDNWERYGRFCLAVADIAADFDLLHLHDGHVGAAALLTDVPTVFTGHNASYPMLGPMGPVVDLLGLSPAEARLGGPVEWYGEANYLKAGIMGADQVTTVSPGHARELAVDETSFGLGGMVRSLPHPIVGILNGIDAAAWDPASDTAIPEPFDVGRLAGRESSRRSLLRRSGLGEGFVVGNVGRMARQKGLQLLEYDVGTLVSEGVRFVFVGNGELDAVIDGWVAAYPGQVAHLPYAEPLARLVSAGADAYLMPSEYEPCGLGQMYAARYGAPTIAHFTGGLEDTVIDIDEDPIGGTGFVFRSFDHVSLTKTIRRAVRYRDRLPALWLQMQRTAMSIDWSWSYRAAEYVAVYRRVGGPRESESAE